MKRHEYDFENMNLAGCDCPCCKDSECMAGITIKAYPDRIEVQIHGKTTLEISSVKVEEDWATLLDNIDGMFEDTEDVQ